MAPAFVRARVLPDSEHRPPARRNRLPERMHSRLVRKFVGLARVAADARRDDILPCRAPTFVPWQHVVEVQVTLREDLGAILTRELVPQEHIAAGEADLHAR